MKNSALFKSKIIKIIPYIIIAVSVFLFYKFVGCPFITFFGICCPGCGMTRAFTAFLKFDFLLAFQMHPLVFFMPAALVVYLMRKKIPPKVFDGMMITAAIVMFAVYFIRLFSGSEIVYINLEEGLVFKCLQTLFK